MNIETIRTVFTYVIALVIIVGGGLLLVVPSRIPANELLTFEQVVVGVVLGWVFSDRSASASSSRTLQALYTPAPQFGPDGQTATIEGPAGPAGPTGPTGPTGPAQPPYVP